MAESSPTHFRRRFIISTNVLLQCLAVLALMIMINWLVSRHYDALRYDWTASGYYKISDKTKQVLSSLKEPLKVIVYFRPTSESDIDGRIFDDVRSLLKEFKFFGKQKLAVEYVDPDKDLARAEQLAAEYQFDRQEPALVIFAAGSRHKYVSREEMVDLDTSAYGQPPRLKAFKAEGAFLSSVQSVTEGEPPTIYFLTGHGERDPESFDQRIGYSTLDAYIKRDNLLVQKWNLPEQQMLLPTNTAAIVIAGPKLKFKDVELVALDQYLRNRGRLYVMLDPRTDTGLEALLKKWGVQVDDDIVMRKAGTLLGTELIDENAVASSYGAHAVTEKLSGENTEFPLARSVRRLAGAANAEQPRVTELAMTGPAFWGSTKLTEESNAYDPTTDILGPLPLAVAVESGQPREVNVDLGVTRMIVVGTSSFLDNSNLTAGNLDFFMSGLNWLLKREQLLAVGPKAPEEFRLDMTSNQINAVFWLTNIAMPFSFGIIGLLVWLRRRR